jgi:hypothetical protein
LPPGFNNTIGEGVCGVNGWNNHAFFDTSSYEKDGMIDLFRSTGSYSYPGVTELPGSVFTPVDDATVTQDVRLGDSLFSSAIFVFLRNFTEYTSTQNAFFSLANPTGDPLIAVNLNCVIKVTEQEWLDQLEQAYVDYNVLATDQVQGGQLPMQTECISANLHGCPSTEEDLTGASKIPNAASLRTRSQREPSKRDPLQALSFLGL